MNRRYMLVSLFVLATSVWGQNTNPRIRQLEDFLRRQPHGIEFTQRNDFSVWNYISYDWHAQLDAIGENKKKPVITAGMSREEKMKVGQQIDSINALTCQQLMDALDTIRLAFSSVRKEASESYMYEYHKEGNDSINYSVAFSHSDSPLETTPWGDYVHAREALKFRCETSKSSKIYGDGWWYRSDPETDSLGLAINGWYQGPFAHYYHYFEEPRGISKEDMRPFDIAAFEAHIQPALEPLKKLKGAKIYPVYWQHDEGYVGTGNELLAGLRFDYSHPAGLTTGTYYFIPVQHKAEPIFDRLDSLAHDYVNRHPEQPYTYHHIPIILRIHPSGYIFHDVFYHKYGDIVEVDSDECDINSTKYNLRCYQDDEGLHILSITTKGRLWIPKGFQKMKRWVNGKATYRKN